VLFALKYATLDMGENEDTVCIVVSSDTGTTEFMTMITVILFEGAGYSSGPFY
jgi:hypothetical protein